MGPFLIAAADGNGNGVRDTVDAIANTHDQIVMALIGVVAASVAALVFVIKNGRDIRAGASDAATAATQATAANTAVNNIGPGQHTLYNLVSSIKDDVDELKATQQEFSKHGWVALPADLATAPALTATIRSIQAHDDLLDRKLDTILTELRAHVHETATREG